MWHASAARHDRASWQVKLLVDHRERLVAERPWTSNRLGWQPLQLDPIWNRRPAGDPAQASATAPHGSRGPPPGGVQVSTICQAQVAAIGSLTAQLGQLDHERCHRVTRSAQTCSRCLVVGR
jgi:transposase